MDVLCLTSIDDKVEYVNNMILAIFDIHAPLKTVVMKPNFGPYVTGIIMLMINIINKA